MPMSRQKKLVAINGEQRRQSFSPSQFPVRPQPRPFKESTESTMNRLSTLSMLAMTVLCLGIAVPTDPAGARQKSLKETIIGTWSVTSVSDEYKDGKRSNAWGAGMKGSIIFDHNGRFSHILIGEKEPNVESEDPRRPDALVVAYFGRYTVNEGDKVVSVW